MTATPSSSLTDFYYVDNWQPAQSAADCELRFNSAHPIFAGHFPGQPVVPGVCSMAIVKELAERITGMPLIIASTGQVKFLRLLTPDLRVSVSLQLTAAENGWQVQSTWTDDGTAVFKMGGLLRQASF